jgi:tellurite resistance protein
MKSTVPSQYASEETSVWLRGLLTIAWSDGHFDAQEKELIAELTKEGITNSDLETLEPITAAELGRVLGKDSQRAENFLRTAVMVAIADGVFSQPEDDLLQQFSMALGQQSQVLDSLRLMLCPNSESMPSQITASSDVDGAIAPHQPELLHPVREWLDHLEIHDPKVAKFLCKLIPSQCPFERDVNLFGRKLVHIPPMCKLNPLYEQLVGLRFRALSYLADECGEDVTPYC